MAVTYEWCLEKVDENDDIIDNNFSENLSDFKNMWPSHNYKLCLVKTVGDQVRGIVDRNYHYFDGDGRSSTDHGYGESGFNVPTKFRNQIKKYLATFCS